MRIEAEKPTPKYLQLAEILKEHFKDLQYQPDQKIPTEDELIEQFRISRNTVRQALAELVNEAIIYKIQGSGSFFAGIAPEEPDRSYLIGVVVPRLSFYIYPQIIQGIDDVAHQRRYNIVLGSSDVKPDKERVCLEHILEKGIDGLLIEPSGGERPFEESQNFQMLHALNIPVVFMDWEFDAPGVSYISPDDVKGGYRATTYLINAGHRQIAIIYPNDMPPGQKRYQGYRNALETRNIPYNSKFDKATTILNWNEPGHIAMLVQELLDLKEERPTAIFFFNDDGALQGCDAIFNAGLHIPEDVSVLGFDDSELAVRVRVPLTTMMHPKYQLGRWAAEILFDQIDHPARSIPRQMLLIPTVVERQSVKRLI